MRACGGHHGPGLPGRVSLALIAGPTRLRTLRREVGSGRLISRDAGQAASQYLGMIANHPRFTSLQEVRRCPSRAVRRAEVPVLLVRTRRRNVDTPLHTASEQSAQPPQKFNAWLATRGQRTRSAGPDGGRYISTLFA